MSAAATGRRGRRRSTGRGARLIPLPLLLVLLVPLVAFGASRLGNGAGEPDTTAGAGPEEAGASRIDPRLVRGELVAGGRQLFPLPPGPQPLRDVAGRPVRGRGLYVTQVVGGGFLISGNARDTDRILVRSDTAVRRGSRVALAGTVRTADRAGRSPLGAAAREVVRRDAGYIDAARVTP